MNARRILVWSLFCVLAVSGAGLGGARWARAGSRVTASSRGAGAASASPRSTLDADAESFVGVLLPPQMSNVAPRADGKLVDVPVRVGQRVQKGAVLATFDARDRAHDLAVAQAQLKAAQGAAAASNADLAAARHRAARRNATVDVGGRAVAIVSAEESTQASLDASGAAGRAVTASAQVAEQRARIAQLRLALEETQLRAPFDGVVTAVYFEAGMRLHAGETVVRIVGSGRGLRVRVAVPEDASDRIGHATTARLALDAGHSLTATIDHRSPEIDAASRTFLVEGTVDVGDACEECAVLAGRTIRATFAAGGR
jgi:RND family efflux transporter MFP subunit